MPGIKTAVVIDSKRLTLTLSGRHLALAEAARPRDGSLADGVRRLIEIAEKADTVESENRRMSAAIIAALDETAAAMAEMKRHLVRIEAERIEWQNAASQVLHALGSRRE